jgi:uncharacterized protein
MMVEKSTPQKATATLVDHWEPILAARACEYLRGDCTGHDIYHSLRVKKVALLIAQREGLDQHVLVATAYLHDIGRNLERIGQGDHVDTGIRKAQVILPQIGFDLARTEQVVHCIRYHEEYAWGSSVGNAQLSKEALAFQDADRLDAIGALGIARCFAYAGACQLPIWIPEDPAEGWSHGKKSQSAFNHLFEKIIKLRDCMNTETGKQLAVARHEFVLRFIDQFRQEVALAASPGQ